MRGFRIRTCSQGGWPPGRAPGQLRPRCRPLHQTVSRAETNQAVWCRRSAILSAQVSRENVLYVDCHASRSRYFRRCASERHGWAFSVHVLPHGFSVYAQFPGRSHEWTAPCASPSAPPSISPSEVGWAFWIAESRSCELCGAVAVSIVAEFVHFEHQGRHRPAPAPSTRRADRVNKPRGHGHGPRTNVCVEEFGVEENTGT